MGKGKLPGKYVWKMGKEKNRPMCLHKQAGLCHGSWKIFLKVATSVAGLKKDSLCLEDGLGYQKLQRKEILTLPSGCTPL